MTNPDPSSALSAAPIMVEIGAGELIDKITILQIKAERIGDAAKLGNVRHELGVLEQARRAHLAAGHFEDLEAALKAVNAELWEIEDAIRECEMAQDFGPRFVALARAVYQTNDRRAALKKDINRVTGATIVEEKSYAGAP